MDTTSYPIQIHFKGKNLDAQSVPIYELGETLLAVQRMVMQAYLIVVESEKQRKEVKSQNGRGAIQQRINQRDLREGLSLRLAEHGKGSDAYFLDWFNSAAIVIAPHLLNLALGIVFDAGRKYMGEFLLDGVKLDRKASLLFNEFLVLSNRIEKVGDIDTIEIFVKGKPKPIVIDKNVKAYISRVKKETILENTVVTLKARVATAHMLTHEFVDIVPERPDNLHHRIRVDMSGAEFDNVLENSIGKRKAALFEFKGNPRLRPGDDPLHFREFKAESVSLIVASGKQKHKRGATRKVANSIPKKKITTRKVTKSAGRRSGKTKAGKRKGVTV